MRGIYAEAVDNAFGMFSVDSADCFPHFAEMNLREQLISAADVYCAVTGKARGTVSTTVLNRGSRLDEIASGSGDITTRNFERAMIWFSANWPAAAVWPQGVARPSSVHSLAPLVHGENGADAANCPVPVAAHAAQGGAR